MHTQTFTVPRKQGVASNEAKGLEDTASVSQKQAPGGAPCSKSEKGTAAKLPSAGWTTTLTDAQGGRRGSGGGRMDRLEEQAEKFSKNAKQQRPQTRK